MMFYSSHVRIDSREIGDTPVQLAWSREGVHEIS